LSTVSTMGRRQILRSTTTTPTMATKPSKLHDEPMANWLVWTPKLW
jgi:hypothetical protein